jgi:crotonobetainyl-CoA:carnitine CoA-transferase CaiB-like acyl-CoA transferase
MRMFTGFDTLNGEAGQRWQRFRNRGHVDHTVSSYFCAGIIAALYRREITGRGQRVESSMMQATIAYQGPTLAEYFTTGEPPLPRGSAGRWWLPDQAFRAADGYLAITVRTDDEWHALCDAVGIDDQLRGHDLARRWADSERVLAALDARLATRTIADWDAELAAHGVPCAPFLAMRQVPDDPQVRANSMLVRVPHPWGQVQVSGSPWSFGGADVGPRPAPAKNEYTDGWAADLAARQARRPAASPNDRDHSETPLAGIRVVELTTTSLGADYTATQLAELGAAVTKLLDPGDLFRHVGPESRDGTGLGATAAELDRRKTVVPYDPDRLAALLADADVLVTDRDEPLPGDHPRLVVCRLSPFGDQGPRAGQAGSELQIQALTGIWEYLGELSSEPLRLGMDAAELAAGVAGTQAVLAALYQRIGTGVGQTVTVGALQALLALESHLFAARSRNDLTGGWHLAAPALPPSYPVMSSDFPLEFSLPDEFAYAELYRTLGVPEELCVDPRFLDKFELTYNWQEYVRRVGPYFTTHTGAQIKSLVEAFGGICSLGHTYPTLVGDPQVTAMAVFEDRTSPDRHGRPRPIGLRPPWHFNRDRAADRDLAAIGGDQSGAGGDE